MGGLAYIDTNIWIEFFEASSAGHSSSVELIREKLSSKIKLLSCNLIYTEFLAGVPIAQHSEAIDLLKYYFNHDSIEVVQLEDADFIQAASYRQELKIRTPDALHLAVANRFGCREFLTCDKHLAKRAAKLLAGTALLVTE